MRKLRVGGVPEHFNYPWIKSIQKKDFESAGISIEWEVCPGGTGQMAKLLNEGKLDLALLLTEGAIKDISVGGQHRIVSWYVESPLIWGIHTKPGKYSKELEIEGDVYAISRFGSGSHLMAIVHAHEKGWDYHYLSFEVINDLPGAIASINEGQSDIFFWEKFTTMPYVEKGDFDRIAEFPTPWPCFVASASNNVLANDADLVFQALEIVQKKAESLSVQPNIVEEIAAEYKLRQDKTLEWFNALKWSVSTKFNAEPLEKAVEILKSIGIVESADVNSLIFRP